MAYNRQPDPSEELQRIIDSLFSEPKKILSVIGVILLIMMAYSSYYTVQPDEEAVVIRFGKFQTIASPGLHFKLPLGIDRAIKVKTKLILQEEFGFRTDSVRGKRTSYRDRGFDTESLMLTGDLNVANVEWITQFQISEPQKFLFSTRNPLQNIRDISEAIMRRVVGDRLVNDVLTIGRSEIAAEAAQLTQGVLNEYDMGVRIVSIKLQDVNPPDSVKPSFNEVNEAKQEQEQVINGAERHYNKIIPEARGKAEKEISEAEGYASAIINRAKGDADRFKSILKSYRKAPQITRDRMYIESMEKILTRLDSITVVDPEIKGLLPIFGGTQTKGLKE